MGICGIDNVITEYTIPLWLTGRLANRPYIVNFVYGLCALCGKKDLTV